MKRKTRKMRRMTRSRDKKAGINPNSNSTSITSPWRRVPSTSHDHKKRNYMKERTDHHGRQSIRTISSNSSGRTRLLPLPPRRGGGARAARAARALRRRRRGGGARATRALRLRRVGLPKAPRARWAPRRPAVRSVPPPAAVGARGAAADARFGAPRAARGLPTRTPRAVLHPADAVLYAAAVSMRTRSATTRRGRLPVSPPRTMARPLFTTTCAADLTKRRTRAGSETSVAERTT